jgi:hypothetical protein
MRDEAARARAESKFKRKEQAKTAGEQARAEYDAHRKAVDENTVKLRAARLAREAQKVQAPVKKKKKSAPVF